MSPPAPFSSVSAPVTGSVSTVCPKLVQGMQLQGVSQHVHAPHLPS